MSIRKKLLLFIAISSLFPILIISFFDLWLVDDLSSSLKEKLTSQRLTVSVIDNIVNGLATSKLYLVLFLLIFIIAATIFLSFILSKILSRPIIELANFAKDIRRGNFDHRVKIAGDDEIGYLGSTLNRAAGAIKDRFRMAESLAVGKSIQSYLMAPARVSFSGFEIAGNIRACDELGGDYYDIINLGKDENGIERLLICVGDVCGHGVSAALFMTTARSCIRTSLNNGLSVLDVFKELNNRLCADIKNGGFITICCVVLKQESKEIEFLSAGHPATIIADSQGQIKSLLKDRNIPLGIDDSWDYKMRRYVLAKGDTIVMVSDGITECIDKRGEIFGFERLQRLISCNIFLDADKFCRKIVETMETYKDGLSPTDDETLVVIKTV